MTENAAAEAELEFGLGHNTDSRLPSVDSLIAELETAHAEQLARAQEILTKGQKYLFINSDAEDEAATQFMVATRELWKYSEAQRVAKKAPFDELGGAIHGWFKKNLLDPIGLGPAKATESFDPVARTDLGMGPRINMAQTIYKREKAEKERKAREAEAARLRQIEAEAARKRQEEERVRRAEEDRIRREQQVAAEKARREAEEAAAAASRKRNEESKAAAEAAAQAARKAAAEAEERNRQEQARIDAERAQRDEEARLEENRLAEQRAAAEASASASLADLSRARGDKGGVSSLRQFINWRDIDRDKLDYAALGPYFKDKAIDAALDAYADANKATVNTGIKTGVQPIRGVIFFLDAKSSGRA